MIAAGDDPNIKGVVLVMPFISGRIDAGGYSDGAIAKAWEERKAYVQSQGEPVRLLQVWDESEEQAEGPRGDILLHGPTPYSFIVGAREMSDTKGTPWENRISLESLYCIAKAEPGGNIGRTAPRRMLYLAASEDPLSGPFEEQKKVYESAGMQGKEFVRLEGEHVMHYFGEKFEGQIQKQVEWLEKNVRAKGASKVAIR